ncbi:MAG: SUMF1/EgtB/PvdO family nonheme iron enzyme [Planctomycetota bacterium]
MNVQKRLDLSTNEVRQIEQKRDRLQKDLDDLKRQKGSLLPLVAQLEAQKKALQAAKLETDLLSAKKAALAAEVAQLEAHKQPLQAAKLETHSLVAKEAALESELAQLAAQKEELGEPAHPPVLEPEVAHAEVQKRPSQPQGLEPAISLGLGNGVKLELVLIPAGKFVMGSPETEKDRRNDETQHEAEISQPFYMGKYEVTVAQFGRFVEATAYQTEAERDGEAAGLDGHKRVKVNGANWRKQVFEQGAEHPVCEVSWNDAKAFCEWLSSRSGKKVGLPTEAQWEYAARAGTTTAYPWGDNPDDGKGWGNAADQTAKQAFNLKSEEVFNWDDGYAFTAPVGKFRPNAFGLYDTMGNVWEWCEDWYGEYAAGRATDPAGPATGTCRVLRGGSWFNSSSTCRSAYRSWVNPDYRNSNSGFRTVVKAP